MPGYSGGVIPTDAQTFYYLLLITNYPQTNSHLLPFTVSLSQEFRNVLAGCLWLRVSHENAVGY